MRRNLAGIYEYINDLDWDDHHNRRKELNKDTYDDFESVVRGVTLNIPNEIAGYGFFANIDNRRKNILIDHLRPNKNSDNECI